MKGRTCVNEASANSAATWLVASLLFLALTNDRVFSQVGGPILFIADAVPAVANTEFEDEDGDTPGYIVLQANEDVNLNGFGLTDNTDHSNPWFIQGGFLGAGQTVRIFASGKDRQIDDLTPFRHTDFEFPCSVPYVGLLGVEGNLLSVFRAPEDLCLPTCDGVKLVKAGAIARTLIPEQDIGSSWTQPGYNDTKWLRGQTGVGYDIGESNPFCDGLVLYHPMDTANVITNTVLDVSGPTIHNSVPRLGSRIPETALINEGLRFTSTSRPDTRVQIANHPELDPGAGNFTAALWFNADRDAVDGSDFLEYLISNEGSEAGVTGGWAIARNDSGAFVQLSSSAGNYQLDLGPNLGDQWHHVAFVVDRESARIIGYFNGIQRDAVNLASASIDDFRTDRDLYEGGGQGVFNAFAGLLDDVAIWNRAFTAEEISQLADIGSKGRSFKEIDPGGTGNQIYTPFIGTDVEQEMHNVNASAYVRVPFNLSNLPTLATSLKLMIQYDDAFIAYLNGVEVARRNTPSAVHWMSAAASDRPDTDALIAETIDITTFVGLLRQGANVLAFHMMNSAADATRTLVLPELCLEQRRDGGQENCPKSTAGTDFWVAFPENFEEEQGAPVNLTLCITGPPGTTGVVELPGIGILFQIDGTRTTTVTIPKGLELEGRDRIEKKGIHVISKEPVTVYAKSHIDYTTDSFLALPTACLGTEYLVLGYKNVHDNVPILHGTQFGIVAPYDFTTVTITPTEEVGGHPAGVAYSITLHRGQTYQLRNEAGKPADLSGTSITSDKPIGVYGSHRCANVASSSEFFCDFVVEQILPISAWGVAYYIPPLMTRESDTVRILASQDNTQVAIDGTLVATLNRGEVHEAFVPGQGVSPQGTRVTANAPVLVAQYSHSSNADNVTHSDPFMTLIQPTGTWLSEYTICRPSLTEFPSAYVNVVAANAILLNNITVNGVALTSLPGATTGAFDNGVVYARAPLPASPTSAYFIFANGLFALTAYGFDEFDSFGHPGGMQFPSGRTPNITGTATLTLNCDPSSSTPDGTDCAVLVPDLIARAQFYDDCPPGGGLTVTQTPSVSSAVSIGTHTIFITAVDANENSISIPVTLIIKPSWAEENFGVAASDPALEATVWGDFADIDADGLPNIIEEKTGSDPNVPNNLADLLRLRFEQENGSRFLKVTVRRPVISDDCQVVLEGLTDLGTGSWKSGPDIFQELATETVVLPGGTYEDVNFKAMETEGAEVLSPYFLRLRVDM